MSRGSRQMYSKMIRSWRRRDFTLFLLVARVARSDAFSNALNSGHHERSFHVTAQPLKRDATVCPTSYSLCPASLNGGCCPTDRSCGVSSCYLTTAPPTECSKSGYVACGIDQGGGCCPSGYTCANDGCLPLAGSSYSQDCGTASYLCPSSVGYGCCHNDLACGVGYCYATSFSSVSLTVTLTTTISNSITSTITTVIQTAYTEGIATSAIASPAVTKFTPSVTAVAKVEATSDPSSGGLTQAQLGGIIGTAIAVVIVVGLATFLILRRLNTVAREHKAAAARYSGSGSNKKSSNRPRPTPSVYESMSIDPLMMSETGDNTTPGSGGVHRPSAVFSQRSGYDIAVSPPIPAPYVSPRAYSDGYQPVPISDSPYYDSSSHHRSRSDESQGDSQLAWRTNQGDYFNIDPALRDQNLRHGHDPRPSLQLHSRQTSDVSQQSEGSDLVELDGTRHVERRDGLLPIGGPKISRMDVRRHSAEKSRRSNSTDNIRRDLGAAPGMSQRLENVQESPIDNKDKGKGLPEQSAKEPQGYTTNQIPNITIPTVLTDRSSVERQERQKVLGNLDDLRLRDSG